MERQIFSSSQRVSKIIINHKDHSRCHQEVPNPIKIDVEGNNMY